MNQSKDIPIVSNKTLLIATLSATILSIILYFTMVLPAEFNKDPTGIGKKLGLTVLSEPIKQVKQNQYASSTDTSTYAFREDSIKVTVPANKGIEYKFDLKEFANFTYEWNTQDESQLLFDFHGEPTGDTTGYFESYALASTNKMKGSTTVPFDGTHGWYWENNTNNDIHIELKTSGNYRVIGLK